MIKRLWPYLLKYKARLTAGFLFIVLSNLVAIVNPLIVKEAIDYLGRQIVPLRLLRYGLLLVGVTVIAGVFRFFTRKTVIVVSRLIENDLRNDLFTRLQSLPAAFYLRNNTGDIMARLTNDLTAIRSVLGPGLMYTFNTVTAFVFAITMMLKISPLLTLIALIPAPLMVYVVNRLNQEINRRFLDVQNQFAAISTRTQENLAGIRIVKAYVRERSEIDLFNVLNKDYIKKNMHYMKVYAAFRPIMMLIVGAGIAMILLIGGRLIINGTITLGQFVAFNLYMNMLVWPSIALGWVMGLFYQGVASMKRLDHILLEQPMQQQALPPSPQSAVRGEIAFRHLSFHYPYTRRAVLQDIHFEIPQGKIAAVVGKTGSGKSTLMHLLTRTFDPAKGQLFVDGQDILSIDPKTLRAHIGYVPQESFLFSDTIHNNIAFGRPDADRREVEEAAALAGIHEAIMDFPDGYETMLGERGINLSGGQKQRIALARAILKKPAILLLDDALSAVDTITEETILNNLRQVMRGKTCLWISHRISAIKDANHIIVLDNGRIVEQGRHDHLIQQNGLYARLHEMQLLEESLQKAG
ncbi:MAG TPA: ABC transporter ATP-binding protein [Caldithrix abyssi]|uniref:ABC transporter ATP-binding protein n=1 Tax=Caldithrix abyssi TaxID=187145 RepID=A0A7V4WUW3_CALAY|nr:ABC transporter ATP-binding protein [Caldithrix abyssi]